MPRLRIVYQYEEPRKGRLWLRWLSLSAAAVCFAYGGYNWFEQHEFQKQAQESFDSVAVVSTPGSSVVRRATVTDVAPAIAKLEIARLGVTGYVQDGFDASTLRHAIGHAPESARPGQAGNVVLAAHRDTFFAGLRGVALGDVVDLRTSGGKLYRYKVTEMKVVEPSETSVMQSRGDEHSLTMITCYPFRYVGSAPRRLIVRAEMIGPSEIASRKVL